MIRQLLNQFKGRLVLATIFSSLSSLLSITLIAQANEGVNIVDTAQLPSLLLMYGATVIALFVIGFSSQRMLSKLGIRLVYQLRSFMLKRVLHADFQNLERIGGHRVYAMVTTDVSNIASSLAILPVFAVNFATIIFVLGYLAFLSPQLFGIAFAVLLFGIGISIKIMGQGAKRFKQLREDQDLLFNVFKTMVEGAKELSINEYRRMFFYDKQALPTIEHIRDTTLKAEFYWVLNQNWTGAVVFVVLGLLIFVSRVIFNIETEILSGFVLFMIYLLGPIAFVMNTFQALSRGKISYQKLKALRLLNQEKHVSTTTTTTADAVATGWKTLKATQVRYRYSSGDDFHFAIGPVDLQINRGEIFFIRGGNGSGKSTFAKVLVGLYQPQSGALSIDDTVITGKNLQWYRNHFATVFSDFYLFEHILDANGELVMEEKVKDHLVKLHLADKVNVVDGRLSTTKLSQGQKKRLAMLLAYAEDAQIYLFDEWAADQDPIFRQYFYTDLLPELKSKGKTVVAITHDDKYFHLADRLCTFDCGIAEVKDMRSAKASE